MNTAGPCRFADILSVILWWNHPIEFLAVLLEFIIFSNFINSSSSLGTIDFTLQSVWLWVTESESPSVVSISDPMDYTVHGSLQTRILEWVAFSISSVSSLPGDFLSYCRWILYQLCHKGSPRILEWVDYPFYGDIPNTGTNPGSHTLQEDSLPAELSGKHGWLNTPL